MRTLLWAPLAMLSCSVLALGCVVDASEGGAAEETPAQQSESSLSSTSYMYVTPASPDSTAPFSLHKANAKPSFFSPTNGEGIVTSLRRAADSTATQAQVDALLATPYDGNGDLAVALVTARDVSSSSTGILYEIVDLYLPLQPVLLADVQQKDALYQLQPPVGDPIVVSETQVRSYPAASAASLAFDYSATVDPTAASAAVGLGDFFYGTLTVKCSSFLGFTSCHAPTAVAVRAVFEAP
ncbi:MAG TPA: hypothetical protein VMI75_35225 [Polyangiaceae bacterium]|nr:hypothetical protein [Polyangiaceae bacterium]